MCLRTTKGMLYTIKRENNVQIFIKTIFVLIVSEYNKNRTTIFNFDGEKVAEFNDFYCRSVSKCDYNKEIERNIWMK